MNKNICGGRGAEGGERERRELYKINDSNRKKKNKNKSKVKLQQA